MIEIVCVRGLFIIIKWSHPNWRPHPDVRDGTRDRKYGLKPIMRPLSGHSMYGPRREGVTKEKVLRRGEAPVPIAARSAF